jgi:hypothetical protein
MTHPLSIGSLVEVTGPTEYGNHGHIGKKFKIAAYHQDAPISSSRMIFTGAGQPWFPASSLRLVEEELKIGDWVEVIGPTRTGGDHDIGGLFQISHKTLSGEYEGANDFTGKNFGWYHAKNLRKLTPEEIQQHLHPVGECVVKFKVDTSEFEESLDKAANKMWKLRVEERLSAIEKDAEITEEYLRKCVDSRMEKIEKRLAVLEGERPEVCECKSTDEPCHRHPERICALLNVVNRMDCAICEQTWPKEDRHPNCPDEDSIRIVIKRGKNKTYSTNSKCARTIMEFAEMVLDSMREG